MYFDALTRKLVNFHQAEQFPELTALQFGMMDVVADNVNSYMNGLPIFVDSHTMILSREPDGLPDSFNKPEPLKPECEKVFRTFLNKLITTLGGNYRVILSMLVWMLPGEDVKRHFDSQRGHWLGRRFNFILNGQGLTYTLYNGETPIAFQVTSGDLFELNNRSYHAAKNEGTGITTLLVVDVIDVNAPPITVTDRLTHDKKMFKPTDNLPLCIWTKT